MTPYRDQPSRSAAARWHFLMDLYAPLVVTVDENGDHYCERRPELGVINLAQFLELAESLIQ